MKLFSDSQGKEHAVHRHFWRCVLFAGLFAFLLVIACFAFPVSAPSAFAAHLTPSENAFTVSPTQGPVSAVVTITGSGVFFADGTQVGLGYTPDGRTCTIVSGGQSGVVQNGAFSGWFRWPASTGTGAFGVCGNANSTAFQIGNYQVLSASAPQVSVAPTKPQAGQKATVSGASFLPGGTSVNLLWSSVKGGQSISLGTVKSSSAGTFTHTFTVPSHSSTGSYSVMATVGGGSPAVMSATTTFHVSGITIVAMPTSTASSRAAPTPAVTAASLVSEQARRPANTGAAPAGNKTGLLLPIALGGGFVIVLALIVAVLVVRRQRLLAISGGHTTSGPLLWPEPANIMGGDPHMRSGSPAPWPGAVYPGDTPPAGYPGMGYMPPPGTTMPYPARDKITAPIPFDPGLVEAMREAQVGLFATPRPPASAEVEAQ
jgi:hypothetical protein